jgi:sugar (glycoside-pentoside-hexuronide) transporter
VEKRLPGLLTHSYGISYFTFNLMMFLALNYYSIFLTDVAMIAAAQASIIMFITHIVDAVSVPFSASIIQNSNMRWGRFRSWLVFVPVSTCIFFTLTFTNLSILDYLPKMIFLSAAYMIAHVSLNFAFNAHLSLISVLSTDVTDRLKLSSRNIQWGMASQVLFSILVIPVLTFFKGTAGDTLGYIYTVAILGIIQILGYWNLFYQSKGYEEYNPKLSASSSKMSLWDMIKQVIANPPLLMLMLADCFLNLAIFSLTTLAVYYFKYIAGDELWMSPYNFFLGLATFAATFIGPFLVKFIGKKNTYMFAGTYGIIGYIILRFFGASNPYVYVAIVCMTILGSGASSPIRHAMYMDTAEFAFYKTGKDASAFIVSMFTLPVKIGIALATTLATAGLALIGYEANMEVTPQFISNLMDVICFIPAGCSLLMVVIMAFYPLTDSKIVKIMETNKIKRAEAKA